MNLEIIQQILSPLKGKKIALFSLGKSGFGILKLLSLIDCEIYAWDDDKDVRETVILEYSEKRLSLVKPEFFPFAELDFFIISPGINLKQDKFSTLNKKIAENKLEVINDIQLFLRLFPQVIKIGITGTNGKSTTTALIHHIIKDLDFDAYIGGNYGIAIGEVAYAIITNLKNLKELKEKIVVIEISSYQLDSFNPKVLAEKLDIAVLTNITKDHIDRHGSFENYILAKEKIFQNQGKEDFAILCVDDEQSNKVFNRLDDIIKVSVSSEKPQQNGFLVKDGKIFYDEKTIELGVLEKIPGDHNRKNIACSFAAVHLLVHSKKIKHIKKSFNRVGAEIIKSIQSFSGLPHRMEIVANFHGIKFVNDSKATNDLSTKQALASFDNIVWMAGGISKEGGIEVLKPYANKIRAVILYGRDKNIFLNQINSWESGTKILIAETFEQAFKLAVSQANLLVNGGNVNPVVLLSPACASFDMFKNFEQRGDYFVRLVKEFKKLGYA